MRLERKVNVRDGEVWLLKKDYSVYTIQNGLVQTNHETFVQTKDKVSGDSYRFGDAWTNLREKFRRYMMKLT